MNNAAMRWPMQTTRAPTRSQRASRVITASLAIATTFAMHAMVGCRSRQLKMPRPDAYTAFEEFNDAFAHRIGRPNPMHLPLPSPLLARLIIREEHMQQIALAMPHRAPAPRVPGWEPRFPDYRAGFDQVVAAVPGAAGKTSTPLASPTELCRP